MLYTDMYLVLELRHVYLPLICYSVKLMNALSWPKQQKIVVYMILEAIKLSDHTVQKGQLGLSQDSRFCTLCGPPHFLWVPAATYLYDLDWFVLTCFQCL